MRLHFLLLHLLDKLFRACCFIQGLFLSCIMVATVPLVAWARLCLGREGKEGKERRGKGSCWRPNRHVCEHVCDTFMGCSVRSWDVKSVPPVVLSKSKGGMEERRNSSALATPADLAQMLLVCLPRSKQWSCREVWGADQLPGRISCLQCPPNPLCSSLGQHWVGGCSSVLMRAKDQ